MDKYNNPRDKYRDQHNTPKAMRWWFGIFMILVYVGIGLLLIIANQTFQIYNPVSSIIVGALLCLYGVYRGYRLFKGE